MRFYVASQEANIFHRLVDKALDVLRHLSRRGSVWPEASATAVHELRDRITQRSSKTPVISRPPFALGKTNMRTDRISELGAPNLNRYKSPDGISSQTNHTSIRSDHPNCSSRLPQENRSSYATQSVTEGPSTPNDSLSHVTSANLSAGDLHSLSNTSSAIPYESTNTPVFDFGSSEWSDFIQANETLDASAPLPQEGSMDPYIGFDIPFWLGQDQYWDILHDRG